MTVFVGAAALSAVALCVPASAAPAAPGATGIPTHPRTARACSAPKPGYAACRAIRVTDPVEPAVFSTTDVAPNATPSGYGPSSLISAYALPSATAGSGQTVAVIDAGDNPNAEADLAIYRSQYGLPPCTTANGCFKKVSEAGSTTALPPFDFGWAGEISLDVDMVSAVCPLCHILLVEAFSPLIDDLGTSVNLAITLGAKFVSNSYGGAETGNEANEDALYFHHPGVAITASTGDEDFAGGAQYPATGKYITAVGGTTLRTASTTRGWSESAWQSDSALGTGSGCSSDVSKPSFQSFITVCTKRAESDVSAVADPATGVAVYQTYQASGWTVYGGTSAAAPIVAGVYALAGAPGATEFPNTYPYAHTGSINDVTSGNNGTCGTKLCTAGAGWDGPTGLGTPKGVAAFKTSGATQPLSATNPGSRTATVGSAVSVQLTSGGGKAPYTWKATGLPPGLAISASGLISGKPTATGTHTVIATVTDASGASASATFSWVVGAVGVCTSPGQQLANPGFESGDAAWTSTSRVIGTYGAAGEPTHSGTYDAWLDGYGATHTDSLSQSVTIPAGCLVALTFYLHIDSRETSTTTREDVLTVSLGATTLGVFSNLSMGSGYVLRTFAVSSFAGQTATLSFTGVENAALPTSFVIDDVALTTR